jgi:hypothetical protein
MAIVDDVQEEGFTGDQRTRRGRSAPSHAARAENPSRSFRERSRVDGGLIPFAPGLRDRASDGVVKASVQHPDIIYRRLL